MWSLPHLDKASLGTASERVLIREAGGGSPGAVEELFRRHWRQTHRAAYLVVHDAAAAEDIAQEAFLAAIAALKRFDRRRPFAPWLHRIAVNRAIDWSRARDARREVGEVAESLAAARAGGEETVEVRDEVLTALASLAAEQRAVLILRYLLEYTPGEIAAMLDLPRGTVNSRLRRGLDQLAGSLDGRGLPGAPRPSAEGPVG